jgi:hypothetical protein
MTTIEQHDGEMPPSLKIVPTVFPTSPPVEDTMDRFWESGPQLDSVQIRIEPHQTPLELLEQLGPSPFERGRFPLIGFY